MVSLAKVLALGVAAVGISCSPSRTQVEPSTPASPVASTPMATSSLPPGRYCYGVDSETLSGAVRLQVEADQKVSGDSSVSIQNEAEGYYSSYAQTLEGLLQDGQIAMDITTWIEYDRQDSQEVWTITPDTLEASGTTFEAIDCEVAKERFVGPDGLEAADLLEGATLHTQRVQFTPGESATVLEDAVVLGDRNVYVINAQGGQRLLLNLSSSEDNAALDVISPSGSVLVRESTQEDLVLPQTGDYQVLVGSTRGNASYTLTVEIP